MNENSNGRLNWIVRLGCLWAASVGVVWLALWFAGVAARWSATGVITVKANMALGMTLGAASLLLAHSGTSGARRWTRVALAAVIFLIGGLTLSEHVFGYDLGIDQALATEQPGAAGTAAPNRAGPTGSLSLTLLGAALLALGSGRRRWAPYLALAVCLVNLAPLLGYLYGIREFYSKNLTGIAWPTVTAMLALAAGVIASVREAGPTFRLMRGDPGSLMLRRLLPAAVFIPLILGWLKVAGEYRGWYDTPAGTALLILAVIVLFTALLWQNAGSLSRSAAAHKAAAEALGVSETKYRELFESIDQGFCTIQVLFDDDEKPVDYRFEMVNPAFERQTGISNAAGRRMREIAPLHEEHWFQLYGQIVLTGESMRFEKPAAQLQRHYDVFAWRIGAPSDRKVAILFNDISDRIRAEDALKRQAELLRLSWDAMIIWKLDGAIESWNLGAERLYGYAESEALGQVAHTLLATEFPGPLDEIRTKIQMRGSWEGELRQRTRDGREVVVSTRLQLVRGSDGIDRVLEINRDVTDYKQAEERLRHAQKLESLGLLAGGVAHDFNNLLVGVIGNASLAQDLLPPNHPASDLIATVVKTGEQAAHLTRQMLAYSGRGQFVVEPLDISALARDIIELARPSIPKRVALKLELSEGLPSIEADRGQVQQILMNLAINAAEAIGSHDGLITVRTGTQAVNADYVREHPEAAGLPPGKYVVLEVRDTGCGMDRALKAKIFDPFFSTKFTGRGLGLAAVAGIVRGHKGAIVVTSAPGSGSTFAVLFPPAEQAAHGRPEARPSAAVEGSGVVLLIDDERVVRDMAKKGLERHGYTVLAAEGGLEAISILKRHPGKIDVAVLDLSMPGMSGEETLPELKKIRPDVKVVVSSGYSEAEAMRLFSGQRVSGFLQKPYTCAVLAEEVRRALV